MLVVNQNSVVEHQFEINLTCRRIATGNAVAAEYLKVFLC